MTIERDMYVVPDCVVWRARVVPRPARMPTVIVTEQRELDACLAAFEHRPPEALTACREWTVHDLAAHLAGNSSEIARIVEAYAERRAVPETQPWDVREAQFRDLDHSVLLRRMVDETERMNRVLNSVLSAEPDAVVPWTQRQMSVAKFSTHMRSEFALHRWDLVGDDETSLHLLSQPELTRHAIEVLGRILLNRGFQAGAGVPNGFSARLRSPGDEDVVLSVKQGVAQLALDGDDADSRTLCADDSAARLLFMWGRRPADGGRLHSDMPDDQFVSVARLCAGY